MSVLRLMVFVPDADKVIVNVFAVISFSSQPSRLKHLHQAQYERWQPRARFKQCLDPTLDDVKKLCISLRCNFKNDRILFHYNGHGVPRPTKNGEIWVFNQKFTKYIPLSLYDLQRWLGAPSIFVFDCQNAGLIVRMYEKFCLRRMEEAANATQLQQRLSAENASTPHRPPQLGHNDNQTNTAGAPLLSNLAGSNKAQLPTGSPMPNSANQCGPNAVVSMENSIILGACQETEDLPQNLELPADLFTACLTTPIRMALRWHCLRHQESFPGHFDEALLDRIPGSHSNRMSLLGEVTWIFTAVTDTIAWCTFPVDLFQKLFRQDLLVAGLFRNFLLAERIMKMYGCTPVSAPTLPPTFRHPMWNSWDHALDRLVHYLPRILKLMEPNPQTELKLPIILPSQSSTTTPHVAVGGGGGTSTSTTVATVTTSNATAAALAAVAAATTQQQKHKQLQQEQQLRLIHHHHQQQQQQRLFNGTLATTWTSQAEGTSGQSAGIVQTSLIVPSQPIPNNLGVLVPRVPARPDEHPSRDQNKQSIQSINPAATAPPGFQPHGVSVTNTGRSRQRPLPPRQPTGHTTESSTICAGLGNVIAPGDSEIASRTTAENKTEFVDAKHVNTGGHVSETDRGFTKTAAPDDVDAASDEEDDDDVDVDDDDDDSDVVEDSDEEGEDEEEESLSVERPMAPEPLDLELTAGGRKRLLDPVIQTQMPSHTSLIAQAAINEGDVQKVKPIEQPSVKPQGSRGEMPPMITNPQDSSQLNATNITTMRRQQHGLQKLYTLQAANGPQTPMLPNSSTTDPRRPPIPGVPPHVEPPRGPPPPPAPSTPVQPAVRHPAGSGSGTRPVSSVATQPGEGSHVYAGSVIGGSGPASFFASQMTAFKVWLQTADEKRPPATQLPILLQILLSQSHRTRAMQLLSEFLDLGPWAVTHCLMVGILPYIVRLFSSNLVEVKPHLVFIWGKIIASAQTEFSRNDSVREVGYKYFMNCLSDIENLSPDTFFQDVSVKQNFIPLVLAQLSECPPNVSEPETKIRMRLWLIFALAKLWRKNDDARWFGIRHNVPDVLFAYLDDISPEVRAATVYALGTLVDNQAKLVTMQDQADQISHQVGSRLVKIATLEASPLVRCELVASLCGLVRQFENQICVMAQRYVKEVEMRANARPLPVNGLVAKKTSPLNSFVNHAGDVSPTLGHLSRDDGSRLRHTASTKSKRGDRPTTIFAGTANIYAQFWLALVHLAGDPYPQVADVARVIVQYLLTRFDPKVSPTTPSNDNTDNAQASPTRLPHPRAMSPLTRQSTHPAPTSKMETVDVQPSTSPVTTRLSSSPQILRQPHSSSVYVIASPSSVQRDQPSFRDPGTPSSLLGSKIQTPGRPSAQMSASTVMYHSAQFPGRRYRQVDQLVGKPSLDTRLPSNQPTPNRSKNTAAAAPINATGTPHPQAMDTSTTSVPVVEDPLIRVQKTQLFAWSCRWFARPLLVKYGGRANGQSQKQNHSQTALMTVLSRLDTQSSLEKSTPLHVSPTPSPAARRGVASSAETSMPRAACYCSTTPDTQLAALCAVSMDAEAVAFADRLSRVREHGRALGNGRTRWLDSLGLRRPLILPTATKPPLTTPTHGFSPPGLFKSRENEVSSPNATPLVGTGHLVPLSHVRGALEATCIRFHPYQPHIVLCDAEGGMALCHSGTLERLNYVAARSPAEWFTQAHLANSNQLDFGVRITDVRFLNLAEERSLLLAAHADGRIRIWRNYLRDLGQDSEIVTAWSGLSDLVPSPSAAHSGSSGCVVHWSQHTGQLAVGGDTKVLRLWDCDREALVRDLVTGSAVGSCTSLTRSPDDRLLAAGFSEGLVRVFDVRTQAGFGSGSHIDGGGHIFSTQVDSRPIRTIAFASSSPRLYAVGANGSVAGWNLLTQPSPITPVTPSNNSILPTAPTRRPTHLMGTAQNISPAVSKNNSAHSVVQFERRTCPPRLPTIGHSVVHCAALKVDLPQTSSHIVVAGLGGLSNRLMLHRIHDGSTYASVKQLGAFGREELSCPTSVAVHPIEPLIVAGLKDKSVLLLRLETRRGSRS